MILAEPVVEQLVSRLARPDRRADQHGHSEERAADPSQPPRLSGDDPAAEHGADDAGHALDRGHRAEDSAAPVGRGGVRDEAGQRRARDAVSEREENRHEDQLPPNVNGHDVIQPRRAGHQADYQRPVFAEPLDYWTDQSALPDD